MREHDIQNQVRIGISKHGTFFRCNVGEAWTGREIIRAAGGGVYIPEARRFNTGLPAGFSDVFGVVPVMITPDMFGQTIGIAAFLEIKGPGGRLSEDQKNFLSVMQARGARAGEARDVAGAERILFPRPVVK